MSIQWSLLSAKSFITGDDNFGSVRVCVERIVNVYYISIYMYANVSVYKNVHRFIFVVSVVKVESCYKVVFGNTLALNWYEYHNEVVSERFCSNCGIFSN